MSSSRICQRGVRKARARILDQDEIAALVAACPGDLQALVLASLYTGCRIGELRAMRRSAFNSEAGSLFVHATKTGRSRNIILSYEAVEFFAGITRGLDEKQLVFRRIDGLPWTITGHSARMRKVSADAGLDPAIVFHELRHTYASGLLMAGVSPFVVADQLGHADCTQVIKTYGHVSAAFAVDQIRRLSPRIAASPTGARKTPGKPVAPIDRHARRTRRAPAHQT
ncbi:MAG: site-specific integrase [Parvibaculum sp.]|uniref:tyrosine-type recombinase/integrase n=1 Tax=Parvibaculum sp. TaxID=2024848 RepID=UPI001DED8FC3|nr:site-specific integrase [Parvibaculum sp.]MBX3489994.1 site-specific integrase [Parvibaculum sp.]MCW5726018.1 site-specific integrase [Parvibaculum sp.]